VSYLVRAANRGKIDQRVQHDSQRSPRRQHLVGHVVYAGPRVVLELLLEIAAGADLNESLERYARIPVNVYRALGADRLPIDGLALVNGGRR
jgi:hypothetical protein